MFGLFLCTYDYYEWKDLVCIAHDMSSIHAYLSRKDVRQYPIATDYDQHDRLSVGEQSHYYIDRVKCLDCPTEGGST